MRAKTERKLPFLTGKQQNNKIEQKHKAEEHLGIISDSQQSELRAQPFFLQYPALIAHQVQSKILYFK